MMNIKKNILIKNVIILLVSGGIAKILGMLGKIIYTRTAGVEVVSLYTLITPTLMLFVSLCQFSFPISISKLSAEGKRKNEEIIGSALLIGTILCIILGLILTVSSKTIAGLLHNASLNSAIICLGIVLPLICFSSIQRGFLHGKENMLPASITNVTEEIFKIMLMLLLLPYAVLKSDITAVCVIILFNLITEITNILIMHFAIKRKYCIKKLKYSYTVTKEIIKISFPTTMIRLISSIGFFLEPIILTNVLIKNGHSADFIKTQYGIINAYIVPILSIPTFFSGSIAAALLPNITKSYASGNYKRFNQKLFQILITSILVGIVCLTIILSFPNEILKLLYNVNFGVNYLYLISPFFILVYIQPTLSVAMQAMNKTNKLFFVSTFSIIFKYTLLYFLGSLGFGMNSLIYSMISGIIITTSLVILIVIKELGKKA